MRVRLPFGRRGLLAASALGAAIVYWRVRAARRDELDRVWEEEVTGAVQEGVAAGRAVDDEKGSG